MPKKAPANVSKSAAIRDYKTSHPDAKPKAIAAALNKSGYDVTAQYVSMILSTDRRKAGTAKTRTATAKFTRGKGSTVSVDDVLAAKKLVNEIGGVEAAQAAIEAYRSLL